MTARRVCLLLSCWTLIYLDPVLGSFSRTRTSEQQPRPQLETATGDAEEAHRSKGAVGPLRLTRIRAGPPLIKGETTRRTPPSAWQQLRDRPTSLAHRESPRPWTSGRDHRVQAGTADSGAETGAQPRQRQNAAPAALRGHVDLRGRTTRRRQPLVIPHDYMLNLYWSLSRGNGSTGSTGTANTVTSLVDTGQGEAGSRDADVRPCLTFIQSLVRRSELV